MCLKHRVSSLILLLLVVLLTPPARAQQMPEGRLLRFPDISRNQIVFSYGGDLWLASTAGGVARRITIPLP